MNHISLKEMSEINRQLQDEKSDFIKRLKMTFKADKRSEVESMNYSVIPGFSEDGSKVASYEEVITITFKGGVAINVNVTGESCGAIYKDIGRAVYG